MTIQTEDERLANEIMDCADEMTGLGYTHESAARTIMQALELVFGEPDPGVRDGRHLMNPARFQPPVEAI